MGKICKLSSSSVCRSLRHVHGMLMVRLDSSDIARNVNIVNPILLTQPSNNGLQHWEMAVVHGGEQMVDDLVIQPPAKNEAKPARHSEILRSDDLVLVPVRVGGVCGVGKQMVNLRVKHEQDGE